MLTHSIPITVFTVHIVYHKSLLALFCCLDKNHINTIIIALQEFSNGVKQKRRYNR